MILYHSFVLLFMVRMTGLDLRLLSPWESKLWSGSVKPSPAALVRAAFKWVLILSAPKKERPYSLSFLVRMTRLEPARSRGGT